MCDFMVDGKKQQKELLQSLKINQLFSVEILVEKIEVTHGPYKNSGDLDNITESEDSDAKGQTDDDMDETGDEGLGTAGDAGLDKGKDLTVGMAMVDGDCRSRSKSPRFKKTCHTIAIDSWAPGIVSSAPYVPQESKDPPRDTPPQLCKACIDDCIMNKPTKSDKCTCDREYCFSFPIDSLGPKINSSSGVSKKKCMCSEHKRGRSREKSKKDEIKGSKGKGDSSKTKKKDSGKDAGGKGKGLKTDYGGEEAVEEEEEAKPKKLKRKCERPPAPDGPLPPLRVSVSIFHIKDVNMNQVDLDKLYPTDDEDIPAEDSDPEPQVVEPKISKVKPVKKAKGDAGDTKGKDKSKQTNQSSSKSSGKSSASSKQGKGKGKTSSKSSETSKQSKNVVKMKKGQKGVDDKKLQKALSSLKSEHSELSEPDRPLSGLSRYRELGGVDTAKCSGDIAVKMKQAQKQQRLEREKRKEVLESLRGVTDFKRGLSFVFSSTPFDIISRLLVEKLEIVVDRSSNSGPSYPIGKVRIKLPNIYRDRVQAGARMTTIRPLWTCQEDTYPIIDCKGKEVGNITVYFCLTSLGGAMVSTSLASETSLYEYTGSAYYISQSGNTEPKPRATGFKMCYGNLQHVNLKDYNPPKNPVLKF